MHAVDHSEELLKQREAVLLEGLTQAIWRNQLQLVYQPQVNTLDGRLAGYEALLRWHHAELGFISPAEFIPLAERNGLIEKIGEWVMGKAVSDAHRLCLDHGSHRHLAVNLSPLQMANRHLVEHFRKLLLDFDVPAETIHIEVTETAVIGDVSRACAVLDAFSELGCEIWMDDFGTGYSSLGVLRQYPVSGVKVDRQFVQKLETCSEDFSITSAIIAMAHSLNLQVVGEGVEDEAQLHILTQLGCDRMQGYLIGRPASLEENLSVWEGQGTA